jgi:RNA polymerase-binding transcription factor DksA
VARLAADTVIATEDALTRLASGAYGSCQTCGDRIPLARLRALPETRACVACAADRHGLLAVVV